MAKNKFILVIDEGTTGVRALVIDKKINIISKAYRELDILHPKPCWVEQDPMQIWERTLEVVREALAIAKLGAKDIAAIGITNQRATSLLWDKSTGKPVSNALTWQDNRATELAGHLNGLARIRLFRLIGRLVVTFSRVFKPLRYSKRGKFFVTLSNLRLSPLYMGVQLRWMLDNLKGVRARAQKGELLAGTIDTWLVWKLTGGKVHATDYSNVSATYLFDPYALEWSNVMLDILTVPKAILPDIRASSDDYGSTNPRLFGASIPIRGVIADQQSALFGETCFEPGEVKLTNGTGTFIDMNVGYEPIASTHGLVPLVAWKLGNKVTYTIEGYINTTGAAVQWLKENAELIKSSDESEALAQSVPDTLDVYFVPAFTGLSSPFWDANARGTVVGLTRGTTRAHMVRAALEGIGYRCRDILDAMTEDTRQKPKIIRADGGASRNNFLLQFITDILSVKVVRPKNLESTALGAAFMAGLHVKYWSSLDELRRLRTVDRTFKPKMGAEQREQMYARWIHAVERAGGWAREGTE